jgi:hypothetical protein
MNLPHLHEKTAAECGDVWLLIEVRDLECDSNFAENALDHRVHLSLRSYRLFWTHVHETSEGCAKDGER